VKGEGEEEDGSDDEISEMRPRLGHDDKGGELMQGGARDQHERDKRPVLVHVFAHRNGWQKKPA